MCLDKDALTEHVYEVKYFQSKLKFNPIGQINYTMLENEFKYELSI